MSHSNHLYSLVSSLPMLRMQEKPAISRQEFLDAASAFVQGDDLAELAALTLVPDESHTFEEGSFAAQYTAWELALRSSILRIRLAKKHGGELNNAPSVVREHTFECDADAAAVRAYAAADPLERERILDAARWTRTEELSAGHSFDLFVLGAYAIQLQIAEKWARRAAGNASENLDAAARLDEQNQESE